MEVQFPLVGTYDQDTGLLKSVGPAAEEQTVIVDSSEILIPNDMGDVAFAHAVADEGDPQESDAPWGRGREVKLAPGLLISGTIDLSHSQSITGAGPGSSVIVYNKHQTVTGETGVIVAKDDRLSKRGVISRGVLANFSIDGANNDPAAGPYPVHCYYAPLPAVDGESHSFWETLFTGSTGDGIKIEGRKQFRAIYAKAVQVDGIALNLKDVNDLKAFGNGWNGKGGAMKFRHLATPKFIAGDAWVPADFNGQATLDVADQSRMLIDAYEIEGRTVMIGRNFGNFARWEMADNILRAINFKIVEDISPSFVYTRDDGTTTGTLSCMVYLEDIDSTIFDTCTMKYELITPTAQQLAATPDYFLQLGTKKTGAPNIAKFPGHVKFQNMGGIVHSRGRIGDTAPRLAFKKHYCDRPDLVEWDFPAGGLQLIQWNDAAPPRNYVKAGTFGGSAAVYNKADYPMGYLWATLGTGGTLDDVNTTFSVPAAPTAAPAGMAWAFRVWP